MLDHSSIAHAFPENIRKNRAQSLDHLRYGKKIFRVRWFSADVVHWFRFYPQQ